MDARHLLGLQQGGGLVQQFGGLGNGVIAGRGDPRRVQHPAGGTGHGQALGTGAIVGAGSGAGGFPEGLFAQVSADARR